MSEEEQGVEEEEQQEGISCKLDSFEPKICGPDPTLILFLGKETENPDAVMESLLNREDELDVNTGILDLADDSCADLSEKYKIDRDASQLVVFQNCEKKGAVSLSADDSQEQIDKMLEIVNRLREPSASSEAPD